MRMRPSWFTRKPRLTTLGLGLIVICLSIWVFAAQRDFSQRLTHMVQDHFQRLAPRSVTAEPGVVVIDIDESSLQNLGQWPWPRDIIAEIVDHLGAAGAASIAFDMAFAEEDRTSLQALADRLTRRGVSIDLPNDPMMRDNDLAFAQAIARNPVVLGVALADETGKALPPPKAGLSFSGSDPRAYLPRFSDGLGNLEVLTQEAWGLGSFSFIPSADNIIREMPLFARSGDGLYPALSIESLRVAQGASGFILKSSDGTSAQGGVVGLEAVKVGLLELPANPDGSFPIHFSGMGGMAIIPAYEVLTKPEALAERIEGRIALIGASAIGLRDIVATPLSTSLPGVVVHAEMIDQILSQEFLTRPDWLAGLELSIAIIVALILLTILLCLGATAACIALPTFVLSLYGAAFLAFRDHGYLADPVPAIGMSLFVFLTTVPLLYGLSNRDRQFVRSAFGRYLSPALVERLSKDPSALKLGGETRDITVLFSDIRGFTALSEKLPPTELTNLLNRLLTPLTSSLLAHEATIDKYIGDAIMALWNAPLDIEAHPERACAAALSMAQIMAQQSESEGQVLEIGIGLHRGEACVGNLGSNQRFSYSAIGDTVNLAARVEGLTKQYGLQILITEAVFKAAPAFAALEADRVRVVGRQEPVVLYALLGDHDYKAQPWFEAFSRQHADFLKLWQNGDFAAADHALPRLIESAPKGLKKFYKIYEARLKEYLAHPPEDWSGIYQATTK